MLKTIWLLIKILLFAFNFITAIGFVYLFLVRNQLNTPETVRSAQEAILSCEACSFPADVLTYALQLGRLDLIVFALTLLGVVFAVFGFAGFWILRGEVLERVKTQVKRSLSSKTFKKQVDDQVAYYMEDYIRRYPALTVSTGSRDDSDYDNIAAAMDPNK